MLDDLRYAWRALRSSPGFALVAILSLALGIGANSAIFSLLDAVLLKTLPVEKPDELRQLVVGKEGTTFTNPIWEAFRDRQDIFDGVFAWSGTRFNLAKGGEAQYARGLWASSAYFHTLGIKPVAGRLFSAAEEKRGCAPVAVLNHHFWQARYGGAATAVGQTISLDAKPFEIIGVAPPGFFGVSVGENFDIAVPICAEPHIRGENTSLDRRSNWWLQIFGRPKPGMSAAQADAALKVLSPSVFEATVPDHWRPHMKEEYKRRSLNSRSAAQGTSFLRNQFRNPLWILIAVTGMVLLIACANLANLLLARATARQREIAIRQALGASRIRLVRLLITESLLIAFLGAAAGLIFAQWGARVLVQWMSTSRNPLFLDLQLDWRVLSFTIAVALVTALLFGLMPAFRATGLAPNSALKESGRSLTTRRGRFAMGRMLVAGQLALSLLLVAGAGLFLRTFVNLLQQDPGFRTDNVLIVAADIRKVSVAPERRDAFFNELLENLRALPGIQAAARSNITPISGSAMNMEAITPATRDLPEKDRLIYWNNVTPQYFAATRTPILAGRDFDARDRAGAPRVVVINETAARKFFPGENAIGKVLNWPSFAGAPAKAFEVIGIVKDAKYRTLREDVLPTGYAPMAQDEPFPGQTPAMFTNFVIRGSAAAASLVAPVREAVAARDQDVTLEFRIFETQVAESLMREKLMASLSGFFGGLALLLASIGLYGVMAYLVNQRRNEIGIRMALGAQRSNVLWLILKEAGVLIVAGLAAGTIAALLTTRYLETLLFGLKPNDVLTLGAAVAVLLLVGGLAAFIPARRAAALDPMTTLREE